MQLLTRNKEAITLASMSSRAPRNPFDKTRGTKPWVLDRIIDPPPRRFFVDALPSLPRRLSRQAVALLIGIMLFFACGACGTVCLWARAAAGAVQSPRDIETPSATAVPLSRPSPPATQSSSGVPSASPVATGQASAPPTKYIVKSGDTLSGIALEHRITVSALKQANGLTQDIIHSGDELIIPH
jgi:hypothetical protein